MWPTFVFASLFALLQSTGLCGDRPIPTPLPNPVLTPGWASNLVTQETLTENICNPQWSTKSIRPSTSYTGRVKIQTMNQYGYDVTTKRGYELDHLLSLELGGHPTDVRNLWPEPWYATDSDGNEVGAHVKDQLENELHRELCAGDITLLEAQTEISTDWISSYKLHIGPLPVAISHAGSPQSLEGGH